MDDEPIWRLSVDTDGQAAAVLGSQSELRRVFDTWHEAGSAMSGHLLLHGSTDTADRAPVWYSIPWSSVRSMQLLRLY